MKTRERYDVHPSVAYARAIIDNLPKTTGRSIDQWVRLMGPRVRKSAATG